MVCNSGFSKSSMKKAMKLGIDLRTVHEAQSKNWNHIWIDLTPELFISAEFDLQAGDSIPTTISQMIFTNDNRKARIMLLDTFKRLWNDGSITREINKKHTIIPSQENIKILTSQNEFRDVSNLQMNYVVSRRAWLKRFPASDYRGIQNYITKDFTPIRLSVGPVPLIRDNSWQEISDPDEIAPKCHFLISTEEIIDGYSFTEKESKFTKSNVFK
jgi:hypothetical protein